MNSNPADPMKMILTLSLSLLLQAGAPAQAQQESNAPPSQTNAAAPNDKADQRGKDRAAFSFPGGTPQEFLAALQRNYRVQWSDVTSIPEEMRSVQIPALRINQESIEAILNGPRRGAFGPRGGRGATEGGGSQTARSLEALVALYNNLASIKRGLGSLVVEGDFEKPAAVMFVPGTSSASLEIKIKAFPLRPIRAQVWDKLLDEIARVAKDLVGTSSAGEPAGRRAMAMADAGGPGGRGASRVPVVLKPQDMDFSIHRDTMLLVVRGPQEFIEAVESIVSAFQANGGSILPTPPEKK